MAVLQERQHLECLSIPELSVLAPLTPKGLVTQVCLTEDRNSICWVTLQPTGVLAQQDGSLAHEGV